MSPIPAPTIFVVEDNPTDVMLIRRAFARAGIGNPLQFVSDGDAAVRYLAGEGAYADRAAFPLPAVMLLDLKLPRRSGLEILQWVRADPRLRRLPVVVLTSSNQSPDINRAYDLGANSYLVKPVEFDDLEKMIGTIHVYWIHLNVKPTLSA
jgi:CheY-like chemotaxis protein